MFETILPPSTRNSLEKLRQLVSLKDCYLAGGTAIALYFGHRLSEDLDFFFPNPFSEEEWLRELSQSDEFSLTKKETCTVWGSFAGTKLSFIAYDYPLLKPLHIWKGVAIASLEDLACMKLDAVATRGTRRDFIDVYWMAKNFLPLSEQINLLTQKYAKISYNVYHLYKSLVYFDDAERDPMPRCLKPIQWEEVKGFLQREVGRAGSSC